MFCKSCGSEVEDGIRFCGKCGTQIELENVKNAPQSKRWKIIAILSLLVIVALIIVIAINLGENVDVKDSKDNNDSVMVNNKDKAKVEEPTKKVPQEIQAEPELSNEEKEQLKQLSDLYKSANIKNGKFPYANDMCHAYQIYANLSSDAKNKWEYKDEFIAKFSEIAESDMKITSDNFLDVFDVVYAVGKKTDSGWGERTIYTGRDKISFEWDGAYREPEKKNEFNHDYATPVDVGIKCKYPYLNITCNVDINLHQTYQGIIMKGTYEFKYQSGNITFDSKNGNSAVVTIYVEDNQVSKKNKHSYDFKDQFHDIDSFNATKVKFDVSSGTARCY